VVNIILERKMNKTKIAFIAKTNLNNDGRILNELKILKNKFHNKISIEFILMPDSFSIQNIEGLDKLHIINTLIRNHTFTRWFTVIEFTFKALAKLFTIRPYLIHAHDTSIVLPVYIYKLLRYNKVKILYDDHEIPNENESIGTKIMQYFEKSLMKKADFVLFANEERQNYIEQNSNIRLNNYNYLLNLPYFEDEEYVNKELSEVIKRIKDKKEKNFIQIIMHQGSIEEERGREKLANFSKILPNNAKILILGITKDDFLDFISYYNLDKSKFIFIGSVPYSELRGYWELADASIVMYLPTYLNNRLCAPNRLYMSFNYNIPIIVNRDNPVLSNFILDHECGFFIEDLTTEKDLNFIFKKQYTKKIIDKLKEEEIYKFEEIYKKNLPEI